MKIKRIWRWLVTLNFVVASSILLRADNFCTDNPYYSTGWTCSSPGNTNTLGTLSYTNATICLGSSVSLPTFTVNPTFINGQKSATFHHTCPVYDQTVYQTVVYSASALYFVKTNLSWPNLPGPFTNPGTYYYKAEYDGIDTSGVCGNIPSNLVATVTISVSSSPPVILSQPTNQTVHVYSNATFSVAASGCPSPVYQWYYQRTNLLAGATNTSLTLTNVQTTNAGNYSVIVSNLAGSVTSSNALLTVISGLSVAGLTDVTMCPGSPVMFGVTASGCSPLTYIWKFGTNVMAGQTNSSLTISNVYSGNSGTYSVIVSGSCGNKTNSANLTVLTNLTVAGPMDLSVCSGSTAVFGVTAFGSGPVTYQWSFGTNLLSGQTNSSLTIPNVGSTNVGTYSITVIGACGTVVRNAVLRTLSIVSQPNNQTVTYGQSATFSVGVAGYASPSYQWRKNSVNIPGANASSYTVVQPTVTDTSNRYDVIISSPFCSQTSSAATLTVNPAPLLVLADNKFKTYGSTNPPLTWIATGYVYGDSSSILTGSPQLSTTATNTSPAGVYQVTISQGTLGNTNYSLSFSNGTLTITQAALTILADGKTRQYGLTNPTLTWTASGFINGEGTNVLSGAPLLNSIATTNSAAGSYSIAASQGTLSCTNYSFVFGNGTLTVTAAALNITADNKTRVVGGINPPLTGVVVGLRNNDNITATYSTTAATISPAGAYPIVPALNDPNGKLPNYNVTITNGVLLVTNMPPTVQSQSPTGSVTNNLGSSISFSVVATGTAPLGYQWYFNQTNLISGAIGSSYSKVISQTSEAGSYTVRISNAAGSVTSAPVVLTVIVPPSIGSQPTNQIIAQGNNVNFAATANGTASLAYQWFDNGVALANGSKYAGATSASLWITNATSGDAGTYSLVVSNVGGTITSLGASLTVVSMSRIIVDGSNPEISGSTSVAAGSAITLRAMPVSSPSGTAFPAGYPIWSNTPAGSTFSNGTPTLSITNAVTGQYTVYASCGGSITTFVLAVAGTNDLNYNGVPDNQEIGYPIGWQTQLGSFRFDTPDWIGLQGQLPLAYTNLQLNAGWSVGGVEINSNLGPSILVYPDINTNTSLANIVYNQGSVRFWFRPDWNSGTGGGPKQPEPRLIETGTKGTTGGSWGLYLSADGTNLRFCTQTNSTSTLATNLTATISLASNTWNYVTLTYSPTNSILYLNGWQIATGLGVTNWPGISVRTNGFRIGTDANRTNWAQGRFDSLETFNYVIKGQDVTNYYQFVIANPPAGRTNFCALAPIALYFPFVQTLTNGQMVTTVNNSSSGNFLWLDWTNTSNDPYLTYELTNLDSVDEYINPDPTQPNVLYVDGQVWGNTGTHAGQAQYLNSFTNSPIVDRTNIAVVLTSTPVTGTGSNGKYTVSAFATIQLISFQLTGNNRNLTFIYRGAHACDAYSNQPPTCQIVSPAYGQVFTSWNFTNGSVPITAAASDPEDGLTNVSFYTSTNASFLGNLIYYQAVTNATTNLFSYSWPSAPHGTNYLTAIATDEFGGSATSAVVRVIVNWPPSIGNLTNVATIWPDNGTNVSLTANVTDDGLPYGHLTNTWSVTSSNGPVTLLNASTTNVTAQFSTNGVYVFTLTATDGAATVTSNCTVTIKQRPLVFITSPTNNAPVNSSSGIPINAAAYDYDGIVPSVQILDVFNGTTNNLGTVNPAGTSGITNLFGFEWTNNLPVGTNTLLAIATDNDGLSTTSAPVTIVIFQAVSVSITVSNSSPCPGSSDTLNTTTSGSGPLIYSWLKNNVALNQTNSYLAVSNLTANTSDTYSVQVSNPYSSASNSIVLTVSAGTTAVGPTNFTVNVGQSAIFATTASGTGPFVYTWSANGVSLTGQTNSLLTLTNVSTANAGVYSVVVSGTSCNNVTNSATLTVIPPPTVYIVLPQNNANETAIASLRLNSVAQSYGGTVTNVVYYNYLTSSVLGSNSVSPYVLNLASIPGGTYVFQAVAYDNHGQIGYSPLVTNTVVKPFPTVQIFQPHYNDVFVAGENILIGAQASDVDGVITNVQFRIGTTNLGNVAGPTVNNLYFLTWTNLPQISSNNIYAIASDDDGLRATSSIPISVQQPCNFPGVSNLVLSASQVLSGETLSGTIILSNAAPTGGEAISLSNSSPFVVGVPPVVLVPENSTSVSFKITTTPINVTNVAIISATYHNQNPLVTASVALTPGPNSSNGGGDTNGDPVLISGNNVGSSGPITTFGFPSGVLVNSFVPENAGNGRGIAVSGNELFYTTASGGAVIHVTAYGIQGSGDATDSRSFVIPGANGGIAGLAFFNGALYAMSGYGSGGVSPQVWKLDPDTGDVLVGPITITGPASDADGFTVLPDGNFLIDDDDGVNEFNGFNPPMYREYNSTTGELVANGLTIDLRTFGVLGGTGVTTDPSLQSLYFAAFRDLNFSQAIVQTDIKGNFLALRQISDSAMEEIAVVRARPNESDGDVIFVRDDSVRTNTPLTIAAPRLGGAAAQSSQFNLQGISGAVTGARLLRAGSTIAGSGSTFDAELGAAGTNGQSDSYGKLTVDVNLSGTSPYSSEWALPDALFPIIGNQLNSQCFLQLTDRVSSVCGNAYKLTDQPEQLWPTEKNILTLAVKTGHIIPQGRCRSFVLTGVSAPVNGTWDVVFRNQIIASSGKPNGWDVEQDHTVFGGFIVTGPSTAAVDKGYQVRVIQPDWDTGRSSTFSIAPSNSIPSAPVLLPLRLSTNMVSLSGGPAALTVALDALAPFGGAYVTLNGPSEASLPSWVIIPAGQSSITTNIQINAGVPGTLEITASYNGKRVAKVLVVGACQTSLDAPVIQDIETNNLGIVLSWLPVNGAANYNVRRSTDNGSTYAAIFTGLTTNIFIDTAVIPQITYYYEVQACSNLCMTSWSGPTNLTLPYPLAAPAPWIIPAGGIYNDQVTILITNFTAGLTNFFTTNGTGPTENSDFFVNGGQLTLTDSATVKAFAENSGVFAQASPTNSAGFVIVKPAPIDCGSNITDSLSDANAFSTVRGVGYYCVRYVFTNNAADIGKVVILTTHSDDIDTVLFLKDNSTNILSANDDYVQNNTDSQIIYRVARAGVKIVEVSSYSPWESGVFMLTMDCIQTAGLNVFTNAYPIFTTNSALLPVGGTIDFGVIPAGTPVTNYITLTNTGNGVLLVSNIAVYPAASANAGNGFSIAPTGLITMAAGDSTNLAVTLFSSGFGGYSGYLIFSNNDSSFGSVPAQQPFWVNVKGYVGPDPSKPFVVIYYPTNDMAVAATNDIITNVVLEIDAVVMDTNPITQVDFYTNSTSAPVFQTDFTAPYTIFWTNPPAGTQVIYAKATDSASRTGQTNVTINVGGPTLTLTTNIVWVGISNGTFNTTAKLRDATNGVIGNTNVVFTVSGAHNFSVTNKTLVGSGQTNFTYTGTNYGYDTIVASTVINGEVIQSAPAYMSWARTTACGGSYAGQLTNTNSPSPTGYGDYYSFSGQAGDPVTFTMTSGSFSTYMFVMNTNGSTLSAPVEALNANDSRIRYTLPSAGTYLIEATSSDIYKTGFYNFSVTCGAAGVTNIAALVSGTNFPNYGMLNFGVTTNGYPVTNIVAITNNGTATLNITGWSLYNGQTTLFTLLSSPVVALMPNTSANLAIRFTASANGQFADALILTNSDASKNPFVVNLAAVANPSGTAPSVSITTPTNNAQFIAPASFNISASATAFGVGVTITNVVFVFKTSQGTYLIGNATTPVSGSTYTVGWSQPVSGNYALQAVAYDSQGRITVSAPVNVSVYPSTQNHAPIAVTDYPFVLANSANNILDVLTNDTDADGDSLTITRIILSTKPGPHGLPTIIDGGKHISYAPPFGFASQDTNSPVDGFSYEVSDSKGGTALGGVYVIAFSSPIPHIEILTPDPGSTVFAGTITNLTSRIWSEEALSNVVRVEYYISDVLIGVVTTAPFTNFQWHVKANSCQCGIKARVIDRFGQYSEFLADYNFQYDDGLLPFAQIDSPTEGAITPAGATPALVQDGLLIVSGSAYQTNGATTNAADYKMLIKTTDGTVLRDSGWQHPPAPIIHGVLNTNDLTTLQNDRYTLELIVTNDYGTRSIEVPFILDSNLKIGVFTFSEQDMAIPGGGIPLSVVRTYNSLNLDAGDFGYGWSWAINDLDVKLHDIRNDFDDELDDTSFSMRVDGDRDVTLTLPDGNRVTFRYNLKQISITGIGGEYLADWEATWDAPRGVKATLTTSHPENGDNIMHEWVADDGSGHSVTLRFFGKSDTSFPADSYDFPGFKLTMNDGTVYEITRDDQGVHETSLDNKEASAHTYGSPHLSRIIQPSGDTIVINPDTPDNNGRSHFSVDHFDPQNNKTRSIYFNRDEKSRIAAIMDSASGANGLPVVKYEYNNATNLARVLKLQDRNAQTYATNTYLYENGKFPHYLTKILDARGVPVARNLYDDSGKLIGVIDAAGRTNRFVHDITGQLETTYDRMGNKTIHGYDTRGNVTSTVDALGDATYMTYDDPNNPSSETSATVQIDDTTTATTYFAYDNNGNCTQVVDPLGHTNLMSCDGNGNLVSQTDPLGNSATNQYNGSGNLISTAQYDAQGNLLQQSTLSYVDGRLAQSFTVSGGNIITNATFGYDDSGNLTNTTDANGVQHSFAYDANGKPTVSSSTGKRLDGSTATITTTSIFDAAGRVTMSIDAFGNTNATFYNTMGKVDYSVSLFSSTNSITNNYAYDARGNVIQTVSPFGTTRTVYDDNARPILSTDRNGISGTLTEYDAAGRVTRTLRATNVVVSLQPDPNNNGQTNSVIVSSGVPYSTNSTEYFDNGRVKSRTGSDGQTTTYQYTANGQSQSVTDPLNHTTYCFYDEAGRPTLMWDALNHATHFIYDALGRQVSTVFNDGSSVTNEYNDIGQRVAAVDQAGRRTQFGYDISGALTNVIKPTVLNPASNQPAAPQWNYQYDDQGRLLVTTDANGHSTTNNFDEFGRQARHWLTMGQVCSNQFDAQGRLWKQYDYKNQRMELRYDKYGRVQAKFLFVANGTVPSNSVAYNYNQLGQLTNITERYGSDAGTGYACLGGGQSGLATAFMASIGRNPNASGGTAALMLLALALAAIPREKRRQLAELVLEIWDEQVEAFHALFGDTFFRWLVGTLRVKAAQASRCFRHPPSAIRHLRRIKLPSYGWRFATLITLAALIANEPGMDSLWTARADYSYPSNDISNPSVRYTYFSYDFDGHLVQVNCPEGVINYGYDLATGRHIETNTQNSNVKYGYDELGRLKTVTATKRNGSPVNETTTYNYDAAGNRSSVVLPNGITTTYLYDSLNRMTNLTHVAGAALKASYSYKLDVTGRRTNAVEVLLQEGSSGYQTNTLSWAYDGLYRLTNEVSITKSPGNSDYAYTNAFVYDLNGNRVKQARMGGSTTIYFYDANDQLTSENNGSSTTYLYDANGSLTNKTDSVGTVSYLYDAANKLRSVSGPNGSASYLYNEQGIRVGQTTGSGTTKYLIDVINHAGCAQVLEETNTATGLRSYVIGDDLLAQADAAAAPNYYLYDGHGSTRQLASNTGTVNEHYGYDAYGTLQTSTSTATQSTTMLYSGEQYDSTLQMYNLRARYYNPSNGRFNARDTFGGNYSDPQSLHKYIYANSDPVNGVDPTGQFTLIDLLAVVAIIAVASALYGGVLAKAKHNAKRDIYNANGTSGFEYALARDPNSIKFDGTTDDAQQTANETALWHGELEKQIKLVEAKNKVLAVNTIQGIFAANDIAGFALGGVQQVMLAAEVIGPTEFLVDDIKVIGRTWDTDAALDWPGHDVLNLLGPNQGSHVPSQFIWSLEKNDQWVADGIAKRQVFYCASPEAGNMIQTSGDYIGQPTVLAREIAQLRAAGYAHVGNHYYVPAEKVAGFTYPGM